MASKIFVNLPVRDLNGSVDFFTDGHVREILFMEPAAIGPS